MRKLREYLRRNNLVLNLEGMTLRDWISYIGGFTDDADVLREIEIALFKIRKYVIKKAGMKYVKEVYNLIRKIWASVR